MKKVYGIFNGCYSDWNVNGFFLDKDKAKKYCAIKNKDNKDNYDNYYVIELNEIDAKIPKVKLKYYYEMCVRFDTKNPMNYTIDEPIIDYYLGDNKANNSRYNVFTNNGWFRYQFNCDSDKKALKIISDKYMEALEKYSECADYDMAFNSIGSKHI